ncbi:MAG: hypothetical protein JWO38_2423 [Gemmataceae bacterium]|nr:hypothetical protein [Gemmataceae bacterium]
MVPFHLHYSLTRRHRLAVELTPWLPCLGACLGFTVGVTYLSVVVSRWFLPLLLLPPLAYRGFFAFLFDLVVRSVKPVDVLVEDDRLGVLVGGERKWLPLAGVIQVYRSEDRTTWTVLHLNGSVLTIPAGAIAADQLDHLKGFARRAAEARRAPAGHPAD